MKTFNDMQEYENTLMVVDLLNLCFRWLHAGATEFKEDLVKTIDSLRKSYKAKYVVLACDKGSSSYRKNLLPEYKQNRKDKFETQSEEDKLKFDLFFEEFTNAIEYIREQGKYVVFRFEKTEADDIAAYIVKNRKKYPIDNIVLVSSDKDWNLLIQPNVMQFSYVTRKEITYENWNEHHDCSPEEYISIKCLQGDSGDNVPGVPGVGPKKALSLVQQYGSAYDIIANMPIVSKYKYIQALNEFGADNLLRNYQLMDLLTYCEDALGEEACREINTVLGGYFGNV